MTKAIAGVLPILHTPFTTEDQIDQVGFRQQVDWVFSVGANGVCLAMVSQLLRLSADERAELAQATVDRLLGHLDQALLSVPLAKRAES